MDTSTNDLPITLLELSQSIVAVTDLRPEKAEQFVNDWLADWAQLGEGPSSVAARVDGEMLTRLTGHYLARYVQHLTPAQQVRFVMENLPSVVAKENFQRCMSLLIEQCTDPEAADVLQEACEAAKLLTSERLHAAIRRVGKLEFDENSNPWSL